MSGVEEFGGSMSTFRLGPKTFRLKLKPNARKLRPKSGRKKLSRRLKKGFAVGDVVWLYLARVQPGPTMKLAHL